MECFLFQIKEKFLQSGIVYFNLKVIEQVIMVVYICNVIVGNVEVREL